MTRPIAALRPSAKAAPELWTHMNTPPIFCSSLVRFTAWAGSGTPCTEGSQTEASCVAFRSCSSPAGHARPATRSMSNWPLSLQCVPHMTTILPFYALLARCQTQCGAQTHHTHVVALFLRVSRTRYRLTLHLAPATAVSAAALAKASCSHESFLARSAAMAVSRSVSGRAGC